MILPLLALVAGLVLLIWSADRFVDGAAATARHAGMSPLLIGMVVVGFGTSAPEMVVSALSAAQGSPGLALGNAFGSNITNIALILGLAALVRPIAVHSSVLRGELPILAAVTLLVVAVLADGELSRLDAAFLLVVFAGLMAWTIWQGLRRRQDAFDAEMSRELATNQMSPKLAVTWLAVGLAGLVGASQLLVWGAVELARGLGVSDLVIGLTIVALGTSLPELASSLTAARKGEDDIALGNVLGSNLFNSLAVVGLAGVIHPLRVGSEILWRDGLVMTLLTFSLFFICHGFGGRQGRINRFEAAGLLAVYVGYTAWLVAGAVG